MEHVYPKAKAMALRALALDQTSAEAHASLGFILFNYDRDLGPTKPSSGYTNDELSHS